MTDHDFETFTSEDSVMANLKSLNVASEEVVRYGLHPSQFIEWYGPASDKVVCFVHGGIFHLDGTLDYLRPAALALGEAGYRVALVEFRFEAGNPSVTFEDIRAVSRMPELSSAVWVGHSSGAIFVLNALFDETFGVKHGVALAPILDIARDAAEFAGAEPNRTAQWIGGKPQDVPEAYAPFEPMRQYRELGAAGFQRLGLRLDIIHGAQDGIVPAARTKDLVEEPFNIAIVPDENHMDVIRPGSDSWLLLLGALG